jgi:predicted amidohydrolase
MASLKVALIQTRTPATPQAALEHVAPLIRQAAAGGAQLILTPEATNFLTRSWPMPMPIWSFRACAI